MISDTELEEIYREGMRISHIAALRLVYDAAQLDLFKHPHPHPVIISVPNPKHPAVLHIAHRRLDTPLNPELYPDSAP